MPCRTDDSYNSRNYPNGVSTEQYNDLKKEADTVTRLLCSVMRALDKNDYPIQLTRQLSSIDGLKEWWNHHQEVDRKRIEKEVSTAMRALDGISDEAKELIVKNLKNN